MNDFKELYDSIFNPIDDALVWEQITNTYSRSFSYDEFKNNISNISEKSQNTAIDENDRREFYYNIFEKWKLYLLTLSQEKINMLIADKTYEIDFKELLFILKNNNTSNFDELKLLLEKETVKKYFSKVVSWDKKESAIITSYYDKSPSKLDYVLSLNIHNIYIYKIAALFIESCVSEGLPYYIKIFELNDRDNTFNIYVDNVRVKKYLSLINKLRKENASLIGKLVPPILMGKVKGYLGVGSLNIYDKEEYNTKRSRILFNSLEAVLCDYVSNNLDKQISYKSYRISLREFLCMFIADGEIDRLIKEKDRDISYYAKNYTEINELKDYIQGQLMLNIENIVSKDLRDYTDKDIIKIQMNKSKHITIMLSSLTYAIRRLIPVLMFMDDKLMITLKERIRNECIYENIDENKICFDKESATIIASLSEEKKDLKSIEKVVKLMSDTKKLRQKKDLDTEEKKILSDSIKEIINMMSKNKEDK